MFEGERYLDDCSVQRRLVETQVDKFRVEVPKDRIVDAVCALKLFQSLPSLIMHDVPTCDSKLISPYKVDSERQVSCGQFDIPSTRCESASVSFLNSSCLNVTCSTPSPDRENNDKASVSSARALKAISCRFCMDLLKSAARK